MILGAYKIIEGAYGLARHQLALRHLLPPGEITWGMSNYLRKSGNPHWSSKESLNSKSLPQRQEPCSAERHGYRFFLFHYRACMEADETPTHVLFQYRKVAEQRAACLGSPASLPEALGDLGGLLSFWSELGWLE
ncbi:jg5708 [Pararge aegeria aegeria]|uniref:Jg5708 protein n=1 Tax=Pararge aegeria aegeria TaxID=348720 RepID=A0A8S4SAK4_9NEOP|nr:jg5708 [Pararge aegeria aegeria]